MIYLLMVLLICVECVNVWLLWEIYSAIAVKYVVPTTVPISGKIKIYKNGALWHITTKDSEDHKRALADSRLEVRES